MSAVPHVLDAIGLPPPIGSEKYFRAGVTQHEPEFVRSVDRYNGKNDAAERRRCLVDERCLDRIGHLHCYDVAGLQTEAMQGTGKRAPAIAQLAERNRARPAGGVDGQKGLRMAPRCDLEGLVERLVAPVAVGTPTGLQLFVGAQFHEASLSSADRDDYGPFSPIERVNA